MLLSPFFFFCFFSLLLAPFLFHFSGLGGLVLVVTVGGFDWDLMRGIGFG